MNRMCFDTGDPTPEVQWYKDGSKLKPKKKDKKLQLDWDVAQDIHTLIIADLTVEDSGQYKVEITNSKGKAESVVTVNVGKPQGKDTVDAPAAKTANEGENVPEVVAKVEDTESVKAEPTQSAPAFEMCPPAVTATENSPIKISCKLTG